MIPGKMIERLILASLSITCHMMGVNRSMSNCSSPGCGKHSRLTRYEGLLFLKKVSVRSIQLLHITLLQSTDSLSY